MRIGRVVNVSEEDLPLRTVAGTMWTLPVRPPRGGFYHRNARSHCPRCPVYKKCVVAVRLGHFCGCERVLDWEIDHVKAAQRLYEIAKESKDG